MEQNIQMLTKHSGGGCKPRFLGTASPSMCTHWKTAVEVPTRGHLSGRQQEHASKEEPATPRTRSCHTS